MTPYLVILSLDPAHTSGWAILGPSGIRHGLAKTAAEREAAVKTWAGAARAPGAVPLVVAETWNGARFDKVTGRKKRLADHTLIGLGAAWGRWQHPIEIIGPELSAKVVRVEPKTWRQPFGASGLSRDRAKAKAIRICRGFYHLRDLEDDEAEAVLIGVWARSLPEPVVKALGKRLSGALYPIPVAPPKPALPSRAEGWRA